MSQPSNIKSARPCRAGAGKRKSLPNGFINSETIQQNIDGVSDSDSDLPEEGPRKKKLKGKGNAKGKGKKWSKRREPPPPPMSPVLSERSLTSSSSLSQAISPEPEQAPHPAPTRAANPSELSLYVNVPPNHQGPVHVKLDLESLRQWQTQVSPSIPTMSSATSVTSHGATTSEPLSHTNKSTISPAEALPQDETRIGFMSLPGEVRNMIYDLAFRTPHNEIILIRPETFPKAGGLLGSCRQINTEAAPYLYSTKKFKFDRQNHTRATYKQRQWTEVGYRDFRHFLKDIGPTNTSLIKSIFMSLEDGSPSGNPHLHSQEDLRFVHDGALIDCFRTLAKFGAIKRLEIRFSGRKSVTRGDDRFISYLKQIKADQIDLRPSPCAHSHTPYWWRASRIDTGAAEYLKRKMERKQKLY
ncbi:MAG: hypothetical protein M1831_006256 [Alyxoria varia]|nr:MAG: hypothetical protein M1831_006256 [Alyxoria varia]